MGSEVFETSSAILGLNAQMADEGRALLGQRATSNRNSANVLRVIAVLGIPLGLAVTLGVYLLLVREIASRAAAEAEAREVQARSEEHTSELQSLMRISYAVFCLKNNNQKLKDIKLIINTQSETHIFH